MQTVVLLVAAFAIGYAEAQTSTSLEKLQELLREKLQLNTNTTAKKGPVLTDREKRGKLLHGGENVERLLTRAWNASVPTHIRICVGELKYTSFANYIFYGTLLGSYEVEDEKACAKKCHGHPYCESANFYSELKTCELNAEKKSTHVADLPRYRPRSGMTYLDNVQCSATSTHSCGFADVSTRLSAASLSYAKNPAESFSRLSESRPHSLPWMVSVQLESVHVCTGVLINQQFIITAASCFTQSQMTSRYRVLLGAHSMATSDIGQQLVTIAEIHIHEHYQPQRSRENDIALLKLTDPIKKSPGAAANNIKPICLPHRLSRVAPSYCITAGWGRISLYSHVDRLSQLVAPPIRRFDCNRPLWYDGQVFESMICAGNFDAVPCAPDRGGPLMCSSTDGVWVLIGVGSWGEGCARKWKPAVYTSVGHHGAWINAKTPSDL